MPGLQSPLQYLPIHYFFFFFLEGGGGGGEGGGVSVI